MQQGLLDDNTCSAIETSCWRLLEDAAVTSPPVPVSVIVEHLQLYRDFYDLQNPTFLDRTKHKIIVHGRKLGSILKKITLAAVLLYDENRIVLDSGLPEIKHDWSTCHEVAHHLLPWHKTYFRGDTAQTLDPAWQEQLEAEANCAASELMFCGPVFDREAKDVYPSWAGFKEITSRYGKSMTATLRRFVARGPDRPMAMMVSTPYWKAKPEDQPERWRHCVGSVQFLDAFCSVTPADLLSRVDAHTQQRRGGPVGDFSFSLDDDNGDAHEFHAESFYNGHYILTLFVEVRKRSARRIIVPSTSLL